MKNVLCTLVVAASSLIAVSTAQAQTLKDQWRAVATGSLEDPPNASPAYSITSVKLSPDNMLMVEAPFQDLEGSTLYAHVHCCTTTAFMGNSGVAVPLTGFPTGEKSGTYTATVDLTKDASFDSSFLSSNGGSAASARAALLAGMNAHEAYINIHTDKYTDGEIRGWLVAAPIPEPATWAMLGVGLAGLGFASRRRKS